MRFGYQLGSGAVPQRDAFAASGKLNLLRFSLVPDAARTGFDQSQTIGALQYCQKYNLTPHVTLFDANRNYPSDLSAYFELFLNFVYNMGVTEASFEVGNEMDQPSWIHPSTDMTGDSIFQQYIVLYAKCSDALKRFHAKHPYAQAKFLLGGSAAATGGSFTARLLSWAKKHDHLMHFAAWHHYGLFVDNNELQDQIRSVKAIQDIPVWLTEVGYDSGNKLNTTADAQDWMRQFLPQPGVEVLIWLLAVSSDGSGLWMSDGAVSPMGKILMEKLA